MSTRTSSHPSVPAEVTAIPTWVLNRYSWCRLDVSNIQLFGTLFGIAFRDIIHGTTLLMSDLSLFKSVRLIIDPLIVMKKLIIAAVVAVCGQAQPEQSGHLGHAGRLPQWAA
jgi:hypothetical protein